MSAAVLVIQALGGGWNADTPPSTKEVMQRTQQRPRRSSADEHAAALSQRPQAPYNGAVADDSDSADDLAARLQTAFDLCELGEAMRLAQLRREHPGATPAEIEALLVAWLETRPGAEHGDGWGLPISWPPSGS